MLPALLCTGRSTSTTTPQGSQTVGGLLDVIRGRVEGCEREQHTPATRSYRCSYCHEQGHNIHTCPIAARDLALRHDYPQDYLQGEVAVPQYFKHADIDLKDWRDRSGRFSAFD